MKCFKISPVVAINKFVTDSDEEIQYVVDFCKTLGVRAVLTEVWAKGGDGAIELAETVVEVIANSKEQFTPLYDWNSSVEAKIEKIATTIYGATAVEYAAKAKADLKRIYDLGLDKLPICMAKTQKSLSDNPLLIGCPTNFNITIREIEIAAGAGFIIPITGEMMRMPGLPDEPASERIDINSEGVITGLF